ncbi:MAG: 50S ribosomal protein L14e [Caldisphaera sp.]|jgi:large subunit ribosomal protein L14e|uniref:50S ribosomal protein L14e n=1 Tax=Caldisphaera sp. TaxID=2060322 RepID=UPI000CA821BF|nr:MAG: 50S ribosomal protein L14e [Caldisphaera sp.]
MPAIEIGRICTKIVGKESGRKCVVVDIIDQNFVLVTGPKSVSGIKRRRVNIKHLMPLDKLVNIQKGASDEEVLAQLKNSNLIDYMKAREKIVLA